MPPLNTTPGSSLLKGAGIGIIIMSLPIMFVSTASSLNPNWPATSESTGAVLVSIALSILTLAIGIAVITSSDIARKARKIFILGIVNIIALPAAVITGTVALLMSMPESGAGYAAILLLPFVTLPALFVSIAVSVLLIVGARMNINASRPAALFRHHL